MPDINWLSDEDYAKAVGQFRIQLNGVFDFLKVDEKLPVRYMYGLGYAIPGAIKEIVKLTDNRLKHWEYVIKETDWLKYRSSNDDVKKWNDDDIKLEILKFCKSKKAMTYYELREIIKNDGLESDNCLNNNIIGRFFRKDLEM